MEEAQGSEAADDLYVVDEIVGDGEEYVPLEDIALIDKICDDVHEAEEDARLEEQALKAEEF